MNATERYSRAMLDDALTRMKRSLASNRKALEKVHTNVIFNLPGPRFVEGNSSPEERVFGKLWWGDVEITTSWDMLEKALQTADSLQELVGEPEFSDQRRILPERSIHTDNPPSVMSLNKH